MKTQKIWGLQESLQTLSCDKEKILKLNRNLTAEIENWRDDSVQRENANNSKTKESKERIALLEVNRGNLESELVDTEQRHSQLQQAMNELENTYKET